MRTLMTAAIAAALLAPATSSAAAAPQSEQRACADGIRHVKAAIGYSRQGNRTTITAEDGAPQTYVGEGPAEPVDTWFEANPYPRANALHALNDAMAAHTDGDYAACRRDVARAQGILDGARREHRGD